MPGSSELLGDLDLWTMLEVIDALGLFAEREVTDGDHGGE